MIPISAFLTPPRLSFPRAPRRAVFDADGFGFAQKVCVRSKYGTTALRDRYDQRRNNRSKISGKRAERPAFGGTSISTLWSPIKPLSEGEEWRPQGLCDNQHTWWEPNCRTALLGCRPSSFARGKRHTERGRDLRSKAKKFACHDRRSKGPIDRSYGNPRIWFYCSP
jgi:hypothetical protein